MEITRTIRTASITQDCIMVGIISENRELLGASSDPKVGRNNSKTPSAMIMPMFRPVL